MLPSGAAPGVTSPGFGCRIAAAYEQRCQPELFLLFFSRLWKQEGWWDWNSPSTQSRSQAWQLPRGRCDENALPQTSPSPGPGLGRWGPRQQGRTRCCLQRHRSRCGDGGGSRVWHSASWEPCRKGSFIFPSWRLGDFSSVFVVSLNQVSLFFFFSSNCVICTF